MLSTRFVAVAWGPLLLAAVASAPLTAQAAPAATAPANDTSAAGAAPQHDTVLDLTTAWRLTQQHDPGFQAAISKRKAGQANRALGRAGMLPHLNAQFSRTKNWGHLTEPGPFGIDNRTRLDYTARENDIRLTQTIFDWSKISAWREGNAEADKSLAVFDTDVRDTATRLVNRYLQVLLTQQNVTLAQQNLQADERHIDIAKHRYHGGASTITDVRQAESQRARSLADLKQAQAALAVARRELQAMTGQPSPSVQGLRADFSPQPPQPASLQAWIERAQQNNADIHAGRQDARVASLEVDRAIGQMLPSIEATASYSRDHGQSITLRDTDSHTTSLGAQLNVPLFAGGGNWARMKQSRYKYQQSQQQLAATRQQVAVKISRQYLGVVNGAVNIKALAAAVQASAQTLKAVRKSYQAGTRSISDILDAQDQLHEERRNLVKARLNYVKAHIQLKAVAGALDDDAIMAAASRWFGPAS